MAAAEIDIKYVAHLARHRPHARRGKKTRRATRRHPRLHRKIARTRRDRRRADRPRRPDGQRHARRRNPPSLPHDEALRNAPARPTFCSSCPKSSSDSFDAEPAHHFRTRPPGSPSAKSPRARPCSRASTRSRAWTAKSTPSSATTPRTRSRRPMRRTNCLLAP
jgi:hypothetical protein